MECDPYTRTAVLLCRSCQVVFTLVFGVDCFVGGVVCSPLFFIFIVCSFLKVSADVLFTIVHVCRALWVGVAGEWLGCCVYHVLMMSCFVCSRPL